MLEWLAPRSIGWDQIHELLFDLLLKESANLEKSFFSKQLPAILSAYLWILLEVECKSEFILALRLKPVFN